MCNHRESGFIYSNWNMWGILAQNKYNWVQFFHKLIDKLQQNEEIFKINGNQLEILQRDIKFIYFLQTELLISSSVIDGSCFAILIVPSHASEATAVLTGTSTQHTTPDRKHVGQWMSLKLQNLRRQHVTDHHTMQLGYCS